MRSILGRSFEEASKGQLVSGDTRNMVEMGFWVLRFLENFEKEYAKSAPAPSERTSNGEGQVWGSNARNYLKLMRFVTKFLSTADNFNKKNKPK